MATTTIEHTMMARHSCAPIFTVIKYEGEANRGRISIKQHRYDGTAEGSWTVIGFDAIDLDELITALQNIQNTHLTLRPTREVVQ